MNRDEFIDKWLSKIHEASYVEVIEDFYSVLQEENEKIRKMVMETIDKLKLK